MAIAEEDVHAITEFIGLLIIGDDGVRLGPCVVPSNIAVVAIQVDPVCLFLPGSAADFSWNGGTSIRADEVAERERLPVHKQQSAQIGGKGSTIVLRIQQEH